MGQVSFNEDRLERFDQQQFQKLFDEMDRFHKNFESYSETDRAARWKAISQQIGAAKRDIELILENASNPLIESATQNLNLNKQHNAEKARTGAERKKLNDKIRDLENKLENSKNEKSTIININLDQKVKIQELISENQNLRRQIDEERNGRGSFAKLLGQ